MMNSSITNYSFNQAILEATLESMTTQDQMIILGEGVSDPKAIFGTTAGLSSKFGTDRIIETPIAENTMMGIALGLSLNGFIPLIIHQRVDFTLYAADQIINNIAKWRSMFGLHQKLPLVMRAIMGQGWGQGHQHSQTLQSFYAKIPGLTVITPSTPYSAYGLLLSALQHTDPVIFLEHRWCQNIMAPRPDTFKTIPLFNSEFLAKGNDLTIVTNSYWSIEAFKALFFLQQHNISADLIDLRNISHIDYPQIIQSLHKTKKLIVIDGDHSKMGIADEIISFVSQHNISLACPPLKISHPNAYSPSSKYLANKFFINAEQIYYSIINFLALDIQPNHDALYYFKNRILDQPDNYNFSIPNK